MSFMFNPYPFDDPRAVNRPAVPETVSELIQSGTGSAAQYIVEELLNKVNHSSSGIIMAIDGYIGAEFGQLINLISQHLLQASVSLQTICFAEMFKSPQKLEKELSAYLEADHRKDPVSLFGKLFKGDYEALIDQNKLDVLIGTLKEVKGVGRGAKKVVIIYGCGCTLKTLRSLYDFISYIDVTPKEVILRARRGCFANLGDENAKPIKALLRRCYYVDFEVAGHLRWNLIRENKIDFYVCGNNPANLSLLPREAFNALMDILVSYPLRCKPVYLEGVWGGQYFKKLRNLPDSMRNCAWIFDLIPLEVSLVVEVGSLQLDFPFFTFVQKEGERLMGKVAMKQFGGYFPIRFNYDDSYHASGNMSIQVHSGDQYNRENYAELGRQDESYYVVATGHDARTYLGFKDEADPNEFIRKIKKSERTNSPVDYQHYVGNVDSSPGVQVLLPAGTIHSSGRNQVVLEIGSLTVGSYTYKLYDYLRADLDGKPRPIHSWHGEQVVRKDYTTSWARKNLVQEPRLVREGKGWSEHIIGEHDLIYFSLRRLAFEREIEEDTKGKFHVLTLVEGHQIMVESLDHPGHAYTQNFLDVIVVPADMGRYIIRNLGNQPVYVHKTMLKDGFENESIPDH